MNYLNAVSELSGIWRSFADLVATGKLWGDQGNVRNPIIDAEALLCLLLPEAYVRRLNTRRDDNTIVSSTDVGRILAKLAPREKFSARSDQTAAPLLETTVDNLLTLLKEYFEYHGGVTPSFAAGSYLTLVPNVDLSPSADDEAGLRKKVEVVDVYTYSLTLSLLVLMLLDRWSPVSDKRSKIVEEIRQYAKARLTGAMEGLVDSFVVTEGTASTTWEGKTNRAWPGSKSYGLRDVRDYLNRQRNMKIGSLDTNAFEVGWSWGPLAPSQRFGTREPRQDEREDRVYAIRAPYLYFTVGAIDGIRDLFTPDAQASNIFNARQLELAAILRTYVDLAIKYWAALCRGESGEVWPIEDIPWRTADGHASEYWTLYLLRIVLPDSGTSEHDAARHIGILRELAQRGRITRQPVPEDVDPALQLHAPGIPLKLEYAEEQSEPSHQAQWQIYDFAPQLLKACGQLLEITREPIERAAVVNLIHAAWDHLGLRRAGAGLWDTLKQVFPSFTDSRPKHNESARVESWYVTERVVEALVAVTQGEISRPSDPSSVVLFLNELVSELDWRVAVREVESDEAASELKAQRGTIHQARVALLQGKTTEALQHLFPLLDPRKRTDV